MTKIRAFHFGSRWSKFLIVSLGLLLANIAVSATSAKEPQFTASATPSAFPIVTGEQKNITIRIASLYDFESEVQLKIGRAPRDLIARLENQRIFVGRNGEALVNLNVELPAKSTLTGTHYVEIEIRGKGILQALELAIGIVKQGTQYVAIRDWQFVPPTVYIKKGSSVKWTNEDSVDHTATSENKTFDSGLLGFGKSWETRFDQEGVYPYYCIPHPSMVARVWVLP